MSNSDKIIILSNKDSFDQIVLKSEIPVIVDFYADWCGPCKKLGPVLQDLITKSNKNFKIVKVNVDDNPDLSDKYGVTGIPHVILFIGGKQEASFSGFDLNSLENMISKIK